jgi:hypothetical protein
MHLTSHEGFLQCDSRLAVKAEAGRGMHRMSNRTEETLGRGKLIRCALTTISPPSCFKQKVLLYRHFCHSQAAATKQIFESRSCDIVARHEVDEPRLSACVRAHFSIFPTWIARVLVLTFTDTPSQGHRLRGLYQTGSHDEGRDQKNTTPKL